jgi:hypothetical protein
LLATLGVANKPDWIEMRQRPSQLVEFGCRTVHFQPGEVSYLERFRKHRAHVVQMGKKRRGVGICLAAENLIAIERESIEKVFLFVCCFLDESRKRGFERLQFSRVNFEVRVKADEIRKRIHPGILHRASESVEPIVYEVDRPLRPGSARASTHHAGRANSSIVFHSADVSWIFDEATFSSRCAIDDVPGIGNITGDLWSNHAMASCTTLTL